MRGGSWDRDPSACPASVWRDQPEPPPTPGAVVAALSKMRRKLVEGRFDADLPPGYLDRLGSGDSFDPKQGRP